VVRRGRKGGSTDLYSETTTADLTRAHEIFSRVPRHVDGSVYVDMNFCVHQINRVYYRQLAE
jgi:hypothetical protein